MVAIVALSHVLDALDVQAASLLVEVAIGGHEGFSETIELLLIHDWRQLFALGLYRIDKRASITPGCMRHAVVPAFRDAKTKKDISG